MDAGLVAPFVESVCGLFAKLLNISVRHGEVSVRCGYNNPDDLMAMVGLSTPARGTVSLSFPSDTARAVVSRLIDGQFDATAPSVVDETVVDGLAELVNIVAGSGKEKLVPPDMPPIELSLPTVIRGRREIIESSGQAPWLVVGFTSEFGPFTLGITLDADTGTKVSQIEPFIAGVREFCRTMLQSAPESGPVTVSAKCGSRNEIMALVGLSGAIRGTVMISMPPETALGIVARMTGTPYDDIDDDVIDGLAELINIVAGNAKKDLSEPDAPPLELSIPSVIQGRVLRIDHPQSVWVEVVFGSDLGPFSLRVNFDSSQVAAE